MNAKSERSYGVGLKVLSAAVVLALTGCATQKWVKEYVDKNVQSVERQVSQAEGRVTQLDARIAQTDQRVAQVASQASQARQVADESLRKADGASERLTKAIADHNKREFVEAVHLRFGTGNAVLRNDHKKSLDVVLAKLAANPMFSADIMGQADRQGAKGDNEMLSWKRTEAVRRYLIGKETGHAAAGASQLLPRMSFIGMGQDVADLPKNQQEHRDVTIAIYKPVVE